MFSDLSVSLFVCFCVRPAHAHKYCGWAAKSRDWHRSLFGEAWFGSCDLQESFFPVILLLPASRWTITWTCSIRRPSGFSTDFWETPSAVTSSQVCSQICVFIFISTWGQVIIWSVCLSISRMYYKVTLYCNYILFPVKTMCVCLTDRWGQRFHYVGQLRLDLSP